MLVEYTNLMVPGRFWCHWHGSADEEHAICHCMWWSFRENLLSLLTRDGCVSRCVIELGLIHLIVDWFISFSAIVGVANTGAVPGRWWWVLQGSVESNWGAPGCHSHGSVAVAGRGWWPCCCLDRPLSIRWQVSGCEMVEQSIFPGGMSLLGKCDQYACCDWVALQWNAWNCQHGQWLHWQWCHDCWLWLSDVPVDDLVLWWVWHVWLLVALCWRRCGGSLVRTGAVSENGLHLTLTMWHWSGSLLRDTRNLCSLSTLD